MSDNRREMEVNVLACLREQGQPYPEDDNGFLKLDGCIHRYCSSTDRFRSDKPEWYVGDFIHNSSDLVVTFGSWRGEQTRYTFKSWDHQSEDKDTSYLDAEYKELRQKQREEERRKHIEVIKEIKSHWEGLKDADPSHSYLKKKGVGVHGIKQTPDGRLIVPRYDSLGELVSVQSIDTSGFKKNSAGAPCKNTFFVIGQQERPKRIRFCEGYATGATIHELTGDMVVCCFSCGNILKTTFLVREKYPNAHLVLNADKKTEKLCEQWENTYKGTIQVPQDCEETDFNDLYLEKGRDTALRQIVINKLETVSIKEFLEDDSIEEESPILTYKLGGIKDVCVIHDTTINLIYSAAGVGKTMIMYELCIALAAGQPFMKFNVPRKFKVAFIDMEMSSYGAKERLLEIFQRREIDEMDTLEFFNRCYASAKRKKNVKINLSNPKDRALLDEVIERNDIIFIDNLQNCMDAVGGRDSLQMSYEAIWQEVSDWLMEWKFKGKTFFIAHHENKGGVMKGSGRIKDDIDYQIHLTRPKIVPENGFAVVYELEKTRRAPQCLSNKKMYAYKNPESRWFAKWDVTPYEE